VIAAVSRKRERRWRWAGLWLYALHLLTVWGLALSNIFLGLAIVVTPRVVRRAALPWERLRPLLLPMAAYSLFVIASIIASYDVRTSAGSLSELFALSTLLLGPLLVRGERSVRRVVNGLIAIASLIAIEAIVQYRGSLGDVSKRPPGPFSHYMTLSGVLLVCDVFLLTALAYGRRGVWRYIALVLINLALLGSLTRGAWLALALTAVVLVAVRKPRILLALPVVAVLFVAAAPVPLLHRVLSLGNLRDTSNYDRLCMIDAGVRMIAEHPVFGMGPDMVEIRYPIYRHPTAPRYWVPHLHNSFLELAAESGLPALLAYLWLVAAAVRLALARYRAEGGAAGGRADLYLGTLLALLAFNLAGLFENNWGDAEVKRMALFAIALPFCLLLEKDDAGARDLAGGE